MLPGRTVRFATITTVALVAGLLSGPASTAIGGDGDGKLTLGYECRFPSGAQDVTVALTQDYPGGAAVGKPIQPGALKAVVTIPRAGVAAMLPAPAAALSGSAALTVHVSQGTSTADAPWPGLTAPGVPADGTDDVQLAFGGTVPPLSVTAPGAVAFEAGDLALTLHPVAAPTPPATPAPTASGTATGFGTSSGRTTAAGSIPPALPDITGDCSPKSGQDTLLATVRAAGDPTGPTGSPTPG
ncbi:DUF6801 domain-containing protein, partial [Streptomyces sp. IBSBF 2435]|uniref:DUF6801 domain-containing protein n=1 Tax=Streptomyces sp. IBSBF 2435 TaxID=2903531 RepID=UPI002FDC1F63